MEKAKEAAKALLAKGSGRKLNLGNLKRKRATATTCAEVIDKVNLLFTFVDQDVAAEVIKTVAKEVYEASGITCTSSELAKLENAMVVLDSALDILNEAYEAIIEEYMSKFILYLNQNIFNV